MESGFFNRLAARGFDPDELSILTPSERAVRDLEGWLNRALAKPDDAFPRIPLRLVHQGGWRTAERPEERALADAWWHDAFAAIEIDR
ncbi:MAG: hypothetical protein ACKVZJ_12060 [Phycisphaerales bacterium]